MAITVQERAQTLIEALPYIRRYHGKTILIKYGGHAMIDEGLKEAVITDVVLMHYVGMCPILVHGGGPEITEAMQRMGKRPTFVNGLRVTDAETMEIVEMVLAGKTNKNIVSLINRKGGRAVGLSGKDGSLIVARKRPGPDLGFVGDITRVQPEIIHVLVEKGFIPVVCSVAMGEEGESYNLNADHVAGVLAAALGAVKLILLTDVEGIYEDVRNKESLISHLSPEQARAMLQSGQIEKGMIPKVEACLMALEGGVERTHVIDGRLPHATLIELFTDRGIGTMIA